jgi:hypothetical protein
MSATKVVEIRVSRKDRRKLLPLSRPWQRFIAESILSGINIRDVVSILGKCNGGGCNGRG